MQGLWWAPGHLSKVFKRFDRFSPGVPYDCDSIMHFGTETFSLGRPTMEARDSSCDLRWGLQQPNFSTFWSLSGGSELLLMVGMGQQLPRVGTGNFWGELRGGFVPQCRRPPRVQDPQITEIGDGQGSKGEEEGTQQHEFLFRTSGLSGNHCGVEQLKYNNEIHLGSKTDFQLHLNFKSWSKI